jgi:hypothetical protein
MLAGQLSMADPYCLAMVLCDGVHRDRTTGKCTILGTFSVFHPTKLPAKVKFCVYAEVTDGHGKVDLTLRLTESHSLISEEEEFRWQPESLAVQMDDPLAVYQLVFVVDTALPRAGQYHCELLANDTEIMARRLLVIPPPENPSEKE